jgi:hypothetical protein
MANINDFQVKNIPPIDVVILEGETDSEGFMVAGATAVSMIVPADLASTSITFKVSLDGATYQALLDKDNDLVTQTIGAAAGAYSLEPAVFFGWNWLKLTLGTAEAADVTIQIGAAVI